MNETKTLKELKQENKEYYETQIEKENQTIKESWNELNNLLDNGDSKSLNIASVKVIVSQIEYLSKHVGWMEAKLLETKIWLIENQFEKEINVEVWK